MTMSMSKMSVGRNGVWSGSGRKEKRAGLGERGSIEKGGGSSHDLSVSTRGVMIGSRLIRAVKSGSGLRTVAGETLVVDGSRLVGALRV